MGVLYHLMIVAVAVAGIVRGFRHGALTQTGSLLAIAFGCVADRLLHRDVQEWLERVSPAGDDVEGPFMQSLLASVVVFAFFYIVVFLMTRVVGKLLSLVGGGMLDAIAGAVCGAFRWLFMLSICLNFIIASDSDSILVKYGMDSDGNPAEGVLHLAPSLLDCENFKQLARRKQLREAKKISATDNKGLPGSVYHKERAYSSEICICNA